MEVDSALHTRALVHLQLGASAVGPATGRWAVWLLLGALLFLQPCPAPACGHPGRALTEQPSGPQLVLAGGPRHASRAFEHPAGCAAAPVQAGCWPPPPGLSLRVARPPSPLPSLVLVPLSPVHLPFGPLGWTQGPHGGESPALGPCRL